jgi:hypothetical protein
MTSETDPVWGIYNEDGKVVGGLTRTEAAQEVVRMNEEESLEAGPYYAENNVTGETIEP